ASARQGRPRRRTAGRCRARSPPRATSASSAGRRASSTPRGAPAPASRARRARTAGASLPVLPCSCCLSFGTDLLRGLELDLVAGQRHEGLLERRLLRRQLVEDDLVGERDLA